MESFETVTPLLLGVLTFITGIVSIIVGIVVGRRERKAKATLDNAAAQKALSEGWSLLYASLTEHINTVETTQEELVEDLAHERQARKKAEAAIADLATRLDIAEEARIQLERALQHEMTIRRAAERRIDELSKGIEALEKENEILRARLKEVEEKK